MTVEETEGSRADSANALRPDRSIAEVKYLNTSPPPDMIYEKEYPTLRLRLREPPVNCGETPAIVRCPADCPAERQTGGRSSSPGPQSREAGRVSSSFSSNDSDSLWLETHNFGPISDHDHEQEHDHDHDQEHEHEATGVESTQEKLQLAEQLAVEQRRLTFEQWLQSKKKQEAQRRRQKRREAHRVQQLQQMRRQMSERSYAEWLHSKRPLSCARRLPAAPVGVPEEARERSEQRQRSVAAWQQRKQQELEGRRERLLREQRERQIHEQLRRRLSQLAWQRWLAQLAARTDSNVQPQQQKIQTKTRLAAPAPDKRLQRRLQDQVASLYLHVPLSTAQRALRQRLDRIDAVQMHRQRRKS